MLTENPDPQQQRKVTRGGPGPRESNVIITGQSNYANIMAEDVYRIESEHSSFE